LAKIDHEDKQRDSEKKRSAIRKLSARNAQIRGLFGSPPKAEEEFQVLYLEISDVEQNERASSQNTRPEMTSDEHDVFMVIRGGRATRKSRDRVLLRCARISDL
jgi:hypothetical protein